MRIFREIIAALEFCCTVLLIFCGVSSAANRNNNNFNPPRLG